MKYFGIILVGLTLAVAACGGGKKIQMDKNPYLVIENPYWQEIVSGQEDGMNSMVLFLPYSTPIESYNVDSVYFKGYHDALTKSKMKETSVYRVRLMKGENQVKVKPPVNIEDNQALVSYLDKEGNKFYFVVDNIVQGESIFMP